jgi:uncharacterized phage protein gp47/JayE
MPTTLATLVGTTTQDDIEENILSLLQLSGFPTTSWTTSSVPKRLIKAFAALLADVWILIALIARGGLLELSTTGWQTLLARSAYQAERELARQTEGIIRVQNDTGGPVTITVGQYTVEATTGLFYTNTTGATIVDGAFDDLTFKAEQPGERYNVPNSTISTLSSPTVPGITISNPAYLSTGTWITVAGTDDESDDSLYERCQTQWATLGTGSPTAAYINWARTAEPAVTRVKVRNDNPHGPGTIELVLANAAGGAGVAEIATVEAYVDERASSSVGMTYVAATNNDITVTATVTVAAADRDQAETDIIAGFIALAAATDIGDTVYGQKIDSVLMAGTGVINVDEDADDTALSELEVPTFTLDLTWVEV